MRRLSKIFNLNDPGWGRANNNGSEPSRRPQGNRPGGGPPDLDEVWRDFNHRLVSLFGRGKSGGPRPPQRPGSGGEGPSPRGIRIGGGVITVVVLGAWLASGIFIVQEGQVAVVTQFGKYAKTTPAGIQWRLPYPIQEHELVNVAQVRTFEVGFRGGAGNKMLAESLMLTTDENIIDMQFVVQYRLRSDEDGARNYLFATRNPDDSVRQASETAMREIVGKQSMDFVLYEGRTQIALSVQKLMQQILDRYNTGVMVESVAIQNVQPPEQVQAAFDDAIKAGQDRERQISEGEAYANQVIPLAAGQAARMTEQAEGYKAKVVGDAQGNAARFIAIFNEHQRSPQIMRERLYLETMQAVFGNASKVMIDTANGNNMIYLPLDKIMQQAQQDVGKPGQAASALSLPGAATPAMPHAPQRTPGSSGHSVSHQLGATQNMLTRDRPIR
jgi:membrane protease subunit HflK